jgi:hypothetical protein
MTTTFFQNIVSYNIIIVTNFTESGGIKVVGNLGLTNGIPDCVLDTVAVEFNIIIVCDTIF